MAGIALAEGKPASTNVKITDYMPELDSITFINGRELPPGQLGPQCPPGDASNPPVCFDYGPYFVTNGGGPALYSPEWTFNIGTQYMFLPGNTTLTPRVNYSYIGERFINILYSPVTDVLESHGVVSALLTLQPRWRMECMEYRGPWQQSYRRGVRRGPEWQQRVLRFADQNTAFVIM